MGLWKKIRDAYRFFGRGKDIEFDVDEMTSESGTEILTPRRSLTDILFFKKREPDLDGAEDDISSGQRHIRDIIDEYAREKNEVGGKFLKYLHSKKWELEDIINAGILFEQTIFKDGARPPDEALSLLHTIIKADVLRVQQYNIPYPEGNVGPATPIIQLKYVLHSIDRLIRSDAPAWVYKNVVGEWIGNKESYRNSDRFAIDLFKAVSNPEGDGGRWGCLARANQMDKQQRELLLDLNDILTGSSLVRYGNKFQKICHGILEAREGASSKIYDLCSRFSRKDVKFEVPEMYGALLSIPKDAPKRIFDMIERAIDRIGFDVHKGLTDNNSVNGLKELVNYISRIYTGGGIPVQFDSDPNFLQKWSKFVGLAEKYGTLGMFSTEGMAYLLELANLDAARYTESCLVELRRIDDNMSGMGDEYEPQAPHFGMLLDHLQDANPMESMVFAGAHVKLVKGKRLFSFEKSCYDSLVSKAYERLALLREDQRRLVEIVLDKRNRGLPVPDHVVEFYRKQGLPVSGKMLDLGSDNDAWYRFRSSVEGYQLLNREDMGAERVDKDFLSKIVWNLNRSGHLRMMSILLAGLGCGDAWKEIMMYEELQHRQRTKDGRPFNVWLNLYDKNQEMIDRARINCNSRRIQASVEKKDIMELNYDAHFSRFERQLIFFMGGRTPFNLEDGFNRLLNSLLTISLNHFTRPDGVRKPSIILIEGAESTDMEHYWDRKAIQLHSEYLIKRLEMERRIIYFDKSVTQPVVVRQTPLGETADTTYAAIQSPEKDRVEFYFLTLDETPILAGKDVLPAHHVIRCGESRLMSQKLYDSLSDRFLWELIRNDDDEGNLVLKLIPDYDKLLGLGGDVASQMVLKGMEGRIR